MQHPLLAPVFPAGKEPLPPGMTEEDRANMSQTKKYQDYMSAGMESCLGKTTVAGVFGTPILAFSPPLLFLNLHQVLLLVASFP
jgi:mitochondrial import inner membrane translocase subunit TIM22